MMPRPHRPARPETVRVGGMPPVPVRRGVRRFQQAVRRQERIEPVQGDQIGGAAPVGQRSLWQLLVCTQPRLSMKARRIVIGLALPIVIAALTWRWRDGRCPGRPAGAHRRALLGLRRHRLGVGVLLAVPDRTLTWTRRAAEKTALCHRPLRGILCAAASSNMAGTLPPPGAYAILARLAVAATMVVMMSLLWILFLFVLTFTDFLIR